MISLSSYNMLWSTSYRHKLAVHAYWVHLNLYLLILLLSEYFDSFGEKQMKTNL